MHRSFFGFVFQPDRFSASAGERKCDSLIGLRQSANAVEFHTARLDMRGRSFRRLKVARGALRILRIHQVDLNITAALDVSFLPSVLAAPRVNHVMAVPGLAEDGNTHAELPI